MSLTEVSLSDILESDNIEESLSESKMNSLENALKENGDENTDIEILEVLSEPDEDKKTQVSGNGLMDLVRNAFDFICENMRYIILGLVVLLLLCNFKRDLFKNTPLEEHFQNTCNFMETSLDGDSVTSEQPVDMLGGSVDDLTSSLESMSATSGTSIQ